MFESDEERYIHWRTVEEDSSDQGDSHSEEEGVEEDEEEEVDDDWGLVG